MFVVAPFSGLGIRQAVQCNLMPHRKQHNENHGKPNPPYETGRECEHLASLSESKTPVLVKLRDGRTLHGWIEYYDEEMLRLTRDRDPNLFIYKNQITYIAEEPLERPNLQLRR